MFEPYQRIWLLHKLLYTPEPYTVNPYQLAVHNGWYYLIGNHDAHDNISHYRVDRITAIEMLPDAAKPKSAVREFAIMLCRTELKVR